MLFCNGYIFLIRHLSKQPEHEKYSLLGDEFLSIRVNKPVSSDD